MVAVVAGGVMPVRGQPVINELMASNASTLADEDRDFSDWLELYNPAADAVNLSGWYLTDSASNRTKWQFPAVSLPAGGYLVIFASNKDRRDPTRELHTNFALSADGEYLGLIMPDGVTVASEYAPAFPAQSAGTTYGLAAETLTPAYLSKPTPGAPNGPGGNATIREIVTFSQEPGAFTQPFSLELFGSAPGQHIRYAATPPSSAGAQIAEPTEASPRFTTPLVVGAPMLIRAAVFSDDLSTRGRSSTVHFFQIDPAGPQNISAFSSALPVWVIDQHGLGDLAKPDGDRSAWLHGFAPQPTGEPTFAVPSNLATPMMMSVRGSSSANFPKSSYNIDLYDALGKKTSRSLLDLPASDEWALIGAWLYDPSHIRNSIVYELSNRMGRWAPRTRPVEVFLNADDGALDTSDHAGIYQLTDKIKVAPDRVAIASMSTRATDASEITGGYILKIDNPDDNEYSWTTDNGLHVDTLSSVVVSSPKADKLSPAQRGYIRNYVQKMENALQADQASGWATRTYLDFLDRSSWVDHHILNTFAANPDAFERSAYFHKDRGGKIVAGPVWDFDRALGSHWDERSFAWDVWFGEGAVQVWEFGWWGIIATDPEFMQAWVDRWHSLRRGVLADESLTSLTDRLAKEVGSAAAGRDAARWPDNVSLTDGTHAGEISHLKNWLVQRARWIDSQFRSAPTVASSGNTLTLVVPAGARIAYTLDGSDPRSLGGDLAPNALLSESSVTVPTSANLQARSYRPELAGTFPGSPWSAAVGGPASTPLSPASRLSHLSIRATVGSGESALIAGIMIADTTGKSYLSRAIGPGLAAFGAAGYVPDPLLSILSGSGGELARNNDWRSSVDPAVLTRSARTVGAFPLSEDSADSALVSELPAGGYTVQIATTGGQPGIGLLELYELDTLGRTANLSTRATVGTGDQLIIGGFVVHGTAHKRMLIRAVGPGLAAFGVAGTLPDPVLSLYSGGELVATNDRWSENASAGAIVAAAKRVRAFELGAGSEDAALLITVPPGAHTVEVRGKGDATGLALLEIYEVP